MASKQPMQVLEEAGERFKSSSPVTASFVDFDLLSDEIYSSFHPFGMMGKDQTAGLHIMPAGGRDKVMYAIEDKKIVVDSGLMNELDSEIKHLKDGDSGSDDEGADDAGLDDI